MRAWRACMPHYSVPSAAHAPTCSLSRSSLPHPSIVQACRTTCRLSLCLTCSPSTRLTTSSTVTTPACCQTARTHTRTPKSSAASKWCAGTRAAVLHATLPLLHLLLPVGGVLLLLLLLGHAWQQIKRTEGVSTTDIVGRMLTCTRVNPHMNKEDKEEVRAASSIGCSNRAGLLRMLALLLLLVLLLLHSLLEMLAAGMGLCSQAKHARCPRVAAARSRHRCTRSRAHSAAAAAAARARRQQTAASARTAAAARRSCSRTCASVSGCWNSRSQHTRTHCCACRRGTAALYIRLCLPASRGRLLASQPAAPADSIACMQFRHTRRTRRPARLPGVSRFLPTSRRLVQFSGGRSAPEGAVTVYIDGAFDVFHAGHVEILRVSMGWLIALGRAGLGQRTRALRRRNAARARCAAALVHVVF